MENISTWVPEAYDISSEPRCTRTLNISERTRGLEFARTAKWCSDGSSVMSLTEAGDLQRFDMLFHVRPPVAINQEILSVRKENSGTPQLASPVRIYPQPAPVLDYIWYPTASLYDPATFCFVASVRECPIKLLDATDGRLRASYKIVDHRERQIAPQSLTFNLTAQRLYCGFEDAIEIFDLSRPGEGTRMPTTPSKKSKDGLKGIISALAFSPSYSPDESFYAAGSFTPTFHNIAMFSDAQNEPLMYLGGGPKAGVTQLRFNPMRPHILYARYRGHASGTIYSWDVRANVDVPLEIFRTSSDGPRPRSNQKMHFDIDVAGRLLSMGDQDASISIFELDPEAGALDSAESTEIKDNYPNLKFKAHDDTVGSVQFHPFRPILLSTSGSRHFTEEPESDNELGVVDEESDEISQRRVKTRQRQPVTYDSSVKIWDLTRR